MIGSVLVIVQARMGSSRLPGKVLMDLADRPMLTFMLERLSSFDAPIVVATSQLGRDDPVADAATAAGARVARGSEHDVLSRFAAAVRDGTASHIVRLTADCPLVDPVIVGAAVSLAITTGADYVSNSLVRTYPDGLDVEVLTRSALAAAAAEAETSEEREHVTPFVYRRPGRFALAAITDDRCLGDERWTVDTHADIDRLREIVARLRDPVTASWEDVLAVAGRTAPTPVLRPDLDGRSGPATAPAARTWTVLDDAGDAEGWIGIAITAPGAATVRGDIAPDRRDRAVAALRTTLCADLQVAALTVPDHWSRP